MAAADVKRWPLLGALIAAILVAALGYGCWQRNERAKAENQLGLASARTISEVFSKTRSLQVATLSGEVIAIGRDRGWMGMVPSSMTVKYPYSVNYLVDMRTFDPSQFRWDEKARTMTVTIPDVAPQPPAVDAAKAVYTDTSGLFISRTAAQRIINLAGSRAQQRAAASAAKPQHMDAARKSAREAVQALVAAPLKAAGLGEVSVTVRYPWEGAGKGEPVRWDESRTVGEVYGKSK